MLTATLTADIKTDLLSLFELSNETHTVAYKPDRYDVRHQSLRLQSSISKTQFKSNPITFLYAISTHNL